QKIGGDVAAQPGWGESTPHDAESGRQRAPDGESPLHPARPADIQGGARPSALPVDTRQSGAPSGGVTSAGSPACGGDGRAIDDALSVSPRCEPSAIELQ